MSNFCTCQQPQFFIPRSAFPYNEKAAYADFVLKIWVEGRFGIGCDYQPFAQWNDRPKLEPAVVYDLIDVGMKRLYALSSLGRKVCQAVESAFQKAKEMALPNARPNGGRAATALTSNLGRGSP